MTLEQERADYAAYMKIVERFGFSFPVREQDRAALDVSLLNEYRRIQRKESKLPANERRVICRMYGMAVEAGAI